jgi:hypothetical protein
MDKELIEQVALLLYQNGQPGKSPTEYQWHTHGDWYRSIAEKVIAYGREELKRLYAENEELKKRCELYSDPRTWA